MIKEKSMTNEKKKLLEKITALQTFINHCESAIQHGLGLNDETYEKYLDAIEEQREMGDKLSALEISRYGIYTSAQLMRKEPELRVDRCKIEAVVELDSEEFYLFENNLFDNQEFIMEHRDFMYQDRDGVSHCLLVLGEGEEDGILVESEGSLYARYSALLPNARDFMQKNIQTMAEDLIKQGTAQTANGSWVIGFDEISQHFDMTVTPNNGIGLMLLNELALRDEIAEMIATEDCIEMTYYLENAPVTDDAGERLTTLFGLMGCNLENVHILDADEEHDLATITELNQHTLTEQGKHDWADVLGAKVKRIYDGYYGTQIEVTGCDPARLESFSKMLAGECTIAESERWLKPATTDTAFELKYDDGGVN
jgi:hypothetical protein